MASVVDWSKLGGRVANAGIGKSRSGKPSWLRIDKEARIRPIGQAVEFVKIFVKTKNGNRSVIVDAEDADKAVALLSAEAGCEVNHSNRFAMNVIDRADGQIKILEGGIQIFGFFAKWQNTTQIHPGSREGYDWVITAEKTGPDAENKKYTPIPANQTPITQEEWELINNKKTEYSLSEIYKSVPLDQVVDRVFSVRSVNGNAPAHESDETEAEAASAAKSNAPTDGPIDW